MKSLKYYAVLIIVLSLVPLVRGQNKDNNQMQVMKKLQEMAPAKGYLEAHKNLNNPFEILGGPIKINISQNSGPVFVVLPGKREIDPRVFGTPEYPMKFAGSPGMTGLPASGRNEQDGHYTDTKMLTPFSNNYITMKDAHLKINAIDATATDAAVSKDKLNFEASWKDNKGNTYSVKCNRLIPIGLEYPTFGGVVTNVILHGFSGIGTPLMPSEYTYFAFWGIGSVSKNGKVVDDHRIVHGMLTEYVRKTGYKLVFDKDVNPQNREFHLMVPPALPDKAKGVFEKSPVKTGFTMKNGKELPFWHVMFENIKINASRQ